MNRLCVFCAIPRGPGGEDPDPTRSRGVVHNVMPYEAKPYFGVSGDLDLVGDTASIEQGFHSG